MKNTTGVENETVLLYRAAAEQGQAAGQYNLGVLYEKGEGVPKDTAEMFRLLQLAADQGFDDARNAILFENSWYGKLYSWIKNIFGSG